MPEPNRSSLSELERRALTFISDYTAKHFRGPSTREVGEALGMSSPNNAVRIFNKLCQGGWLVRPPVGAPTGRPRSLDTLVPIVSSGDRCSCRFELPIVASVAAGESLELWEPDDGSFDFSSAFGGEGTCMMRVRGESMIERHIAPGDFVVVRRSETAEHGDEVVALIRGGLTLKVYQESRTGEYAGKWLFPANREMSPIRIDQVDARIVGIVEGIIRHKKRRRSS